MGFSRVIMIKLFSLLALFINLIFAESRTFSLSGSGSVMEQDITSSTGNVAWSCLECPTLWLGMYQADNVLIGLRYLNVDIPPGADINSAILELKSTNQQSDSIKVSLFGEIADLSMPFSNENDIIGRSLTSDSINLIIDDVWDNETLYEIDITSIVKEISGSPEWQNGEPMTFIFKDNSGFSDINCPESGSICRNTRTINGYSTESYGEQDETFFSPRLTINYTIQNVNYAPSDIFLYGNVLEENLPSGTLIGEFVVLDLDDNEHAFELNNDELDNNYFHINNGKLFSNVIFDFENENQYFISVIVYDELGNNFEKEFQITIQDVFEDVSQPYVRAVYSNSGNGSFGVDSHLEIVINFSEPIFIEGGVPQLELAINQSIFNIDCYLNEDNMTPPGDTMVCNYYVESGHNTSDLSYVSQNSLILSGSTIHDLNGNVADLLLPILSSESSLNGNNDIIIDTELPLVNISTSLKSITNISPVPIVLNFSEKVNIFSEDLYSSNAVIENFKTIDSLKYTLELFPDNEGEILFRLHTETFNDMAGNFNFDAASLDLLYDITPPEMPYIFSSIDNGVTSESPIPISISFNENVNDFYIDDINIINGSIKEGTFSDNGGIFSFDVIPVLNDDVVITVLESSFSDEAGNLNLTPSNSYSINYSNQIPIPSISANTESPTNSDNIEIIISFSASCDNLAFEEIEKSGNISLNNFGRESDNSYSVNVSPLTDGEFSINIPLGVCQSTLGGNSNTALDIPLYLSYDGTRPVPNLSMNGNLSTNQSSFPVLISFSEDVYGFNKSDIVIHRAELSNFSGAGSLYSFDLTPWASADNILIYIDSDVCLDRATNYNSNMVPVNINKDSFGYWCEEKNQSAEGHCVNPDLFNDFCEVPNGNNADMDCAGVCFGNAFIDSCGVCSGGSSNHVADSDLDCSGNCFGGATIDICGNCNGNDECVPQIENLSITNHGIISFSDRSLDIIFNNELDPSSPSAIKINSVYENVLEYNVYIPGNDPSVLRIEFARLTSLDSLLVEVLPSQISSNDGKYIMDSLEAENIQFSYRVQLLGDYNLNKYLDSQDIDILLSNWKTFDYKYELGPVEGIAPYFTSKFDNEWNIQDLLSFTRIWNYLYLNADLGGRVKKDLVSIGLDPNFYILEDVIFMDLNAAYGKLDNIWYRIESLNQNITLSSPEHSSFDMNLKYNTLNTIVEKTLVNLSDKTELEKMPLSIIKSNNSEMSDYVVQYELRSKGEVLASGTKVISFDNIPSNSGLGNIYPNPFNPTTTIQYSILKDCRLKLNIYNIKGELVDELVNSSILKGDYEVVWDASHLHSGIYFISYNIYNNYNILDFVMTEKLILIK